MFNKILVINYNIKQLLMNQTIEDLIEIFEINNQGMKIISLQLQKAVQEIINIKNKLIYELQNDYIPSQQNHHQQQCMSKQEIEKIKREIQDSFKNIKDDIKDQQNYVSNKFRFELETINQTDQQNVFRQITNEQYNSEKRSRKLKNKKFKCIYQQMPIQQNNTIQQKKQKTTLYFSNQLKYEGQLQNKKFDGFGIISRGEDQIYVGSFKNGYFHGQGRLKNTQWIQLETSIPIKNWITYSGGFFDGKFEGVGTVTSQYNEKFIGKFKKGILEGQFIRYQHGEIDIGKWERNMFCKFVL